MLTAGLKTIAFKWSLCEEMLVIKASVGASESTVVQVDVTLGITQ
jgi:hypothetical protein